MTTFIVAVQVHRHNISSSAQTPNPDFYYNKTFKINLQLNNWSNIKPAA